MFYSLFMAFRYWGTGEKLGSRRSYDSTCSALSKRLEQATCYNDRAATLFEGIQHL